MSVKEIISNQAPAPIGPYSQAIDCGEYIFCSGQTALDPVSGLLVGTSAAEQTHQVLKNVEAVLKAASLSLQNVIKTTIFLVDMNDFADVNRVYEEYMKPNRPARSTVAVSALPKAARIEIECIAKR